MGFWLLTKGGNDIFNEHRACTHRIPSDLPAGACQFPQGQGLAAKHHLPSLVQRSPSHRVHLHTRVPGQVHTWAPWYKANTDHQPGWRYASQCTIRNFIYIFLYMVDKSFMFIIAVSDSRQGVVHLPWAVRLRCTSPAESGPGSHACAGPLHPQQAHCTSAPRPMHPRRQEGSMQMG